MRKAKPLLLYSVVYEKHEPKRTTTVRVNVLAHNQSHAIALGRRGRGMAGWKTLAVFCQ